MIRQPAGPQPAALPIELHPQCAMVDSNHRPAACEAAALAAELIAHGAPGGIRTPSLLIRNQALYPLGYRSLRGR
jgi:hypothetical protein